ncbi:hypothetical protein Slin14017_G126960 [Septoria linicola]|nr:hypothetical protein Slin14017_G126960 [Septoria linicola]
MSVLYEMSSDLPPYTGIPLITRGLTQLSHQIAKAEEWASQNNVSSEDLVQRRLKEDMLPLSFQVQFSTNVAKGVLSKLAGLEDVKLEDNETTLAELRERVDRVAELFRAVEGRKDLFEGKEEQEITVNVPSKEFKFTGLVYLQYWVLPNFFFHITTAYDLFRQEGVPLGKRDFLGTP